MAVNPGAPGQTPPPTPPADPPAPPAPDGTGTGAGGESPKPGEGGGDQEKKFTQAELDAHIADRLQREREQADRKAATDREAAQAEALREQSKFKELSDTQATQLQEKDARINELTAAHDKATAALMKHLEAQKKDLPAHILTLLDKLDAPDQLEYIATNADQLRPVTPPADPPKPGQTTTVPPTPKAGEGNVTEDERRAQSFSVRQAW